MSTISQEYDIYTKLYNERNIVCSPDAGHTVKRMAWERIDVLLDCLNELNALPKIVEVHV